ncbi:peptidase S24 [Thermococcus litoralis DSM 5473]|uniref:Signal peptidase I n=1 Tax=Thermococcus litoralis (strain ATCC 51850 / DSM 5473 / JCM 8560 / NS-C) TaxID=523849 RepID=H3ZP43_THELN|nr:signal peptidase I [Thermococcus litoralis]EHR78280.1 peptidase S24 [Thermococcus litoralis DSM 5473]
MKKLLEYFLILAVSVFVVGSIVGALLDRPVFMSYVSSDSMTPTLNRGDLFFINPISRSADVGDIIVFNLRGGWTVHRVVAIVEEGYITKGDNNVATDQQGGRAEPVSKDKIAGKVITLGNSPLKIPQLGTYIQRGISGRSKMLLAALMIIAGALAFTGESKHKRKRAKFIKVKFKTLYILTSAFLLIMLSASIFVSWQVFPIEYAVTSAGGQREGWVLPGSTFEREITIKNGNFYPMIYYLEPQTGGISSLSKTQLELGPQEEEKVKVTINAPEETSLFTDKVRVNAYIPLLPKSLIGFLYRANPVLPVFAILLETSVFLGVLYLISGIGNEDVLKIRNRRSSLLRQIKMEVFGR